MQHTFQTPLGPVTMQKVFVFEASETIETSTDLHPGDIHIGYFLTEALAKEAARGKGYGGYGPIFKKGVWTVDGNADHWLIDIEEGWKRVHVAATMEDHLRWKALQKLTAEERAALGLEK